MITEESIKAERNLALAIDIVIASVAQIINNSDTGPDATLITRNGHFERTLLLECKGFEVLIERREVQQD